MSEEARCGNCKWWRPEKQPTEGILFGECRRSAPIAVPVRRHRAWALPAWRNVWAFSGENEYCGDWEVKP